MAEAWHSHAQLQSLHIIQPHHQACKSQDEAAVKCRDLACAEACQHALAMVYAERWRPHSYQKNSWSIRDSTIVYQGQRDIMSKGSWAASLFVE